MGEKCTRRAHLLWKRYKWDKLLVLGVRYGPLTVMCLETARNCSDDQFRLAVADCASLEPKLGACWEWDYGQLRFEVGHRYIQYFQI